MSRYSKNLAGQNLKVFVANALDYTTDATFAEFIANSPEGEIGVYLSTGVLQSTALTAGDEFFIAQKRDGAIIKTPILKWSEVFSSRLTEYDAPVRKIVSVGYGASSTGDTIGFSFTGASNTAAQTYGISIRETTPGNQPFPIQEGYATVTSTTADQYTVLAAIVSQLNGDFDYERVQPDRFAKVEITSNGAVTEFVEDPTVTNGSTIVTFAGNVTVATGAHVKFEGVAGPTYRAKVGVTAGTSITLDRPYQGATKTEDVSVTVDIAGTAAFTSGTTKLGLKITGLTDECHFVVAGNAGLQNDTITTITNWKLGAGSAASIAALEQEGVFFEGVGSTANAAFRADYGYPTAFASASLTYDQFFIDLKPVIFPAAALPIYEQKQLQRIVIAAPASGASPTEELEIILGL